uniref:Cystatin domain-containing protein n=1 Tax=Glossina palpalis gambiensis TaxID=67801 RepID=A0A1B0B4W2_9MUSC
MLYNKKMFNFKLLFTALAFISIMVLAEGNQLNDNDLREEKQENVKGKGESCVGCPRQLEGEDLRVAEKTLQKSLTKLAAGDGPVYQLVKINSATSQVVSGVLYKMKVVLGDGVHAIKECDIEIWSQPWLINNAVQVTFICPGEELVIKRHDA